MQQGYLKEWLYDHYQREKRELLEENIWPNLDRECGQ